MALPDRNALAVEAIASAIPRFGSRLVDPHCRPAPFEKTVGRAEGQAGVR